MTFGGLIAIFTAIWIYRTAQQEKTGNVFYWVAGSFVVYLILQVLMIYFNGMLIDIFEGDVSVEYDPAVGENVRHSTDTSGLQAGTGGTFFGIILELSAWIVPFLAIAFIRLKLMLKQPFSVGALFGGIKEMFIAIMESFKTTK